jgi:hypothetical protein
MARACDRPMRPLMLDMRVILGLGGCPHGLGGSVSDAFSACQSFMFSQESPGRPMSNGMERIEDTVVAMLERVKVMLSCTNAPVA